MTPSLVAGWSAGESQSPTSARLCPTGAKAGVLPTPANCLPGTPISHKSLAGLSGPGSSLMLNRASALLCWRLCERGGIGGSKLRLLHMGGVCLHENNLNFGSWMIHLYSVQGRTITKDFIFCENRELRILSLSMQMSSLVEQFCLFLIS